MNMSARFTGVVFLVVSMLLLAGCAGGPRLSALPRRKRRKCRTREQLQPERPRFDDSRRMDL